jgi:hypothetical protein
MKTLNFKSKEAHKSWLKSKDGKGIFNKTSGNKNIKIGGKPHKVIHY